MPPNETPSFDEWVDYCFTQAYTDWTGWSEDDPDVVIERENWFALDSRDDMLFEYVVRLFENPGFLIGAYTDNQIGDAIWRLFGAILEVDKRILHSDSLGTSQQTRFIQSLGVLYTDLFDRVCNKHSEDPYTNYVSTLRVDGAVHMLWDIGGISVALYDHRFRHLVDPASEVLETGLMNCETATCWMSTLHGIGHAVIYREGEYASVHRRLVKLLDQFLQRRRPPDWVKEYALCARYGSIQ